MGVLPHGENQYDVCSVNPTKFSWPGCQLILYISCAHLSLIQKNLISIERDRWRLTKLFAIPTAVALSQCTGV
jgi:hypothetical protein